MLPKLSTGIAIKGGAKCKGFKRSRDSKEFLLVEKTPSIVNRSIQIGNMSTHISKLKKEATALRHWI